MQTVLIVLFGIGLKIGKQIQSGSVKIAGNIARILLRVLSVKRLPPQKNHGNGEHILQHAKYVICKAKQHTFAKRCRPFRS